MKKLLWFSLALAGLPIWAASATGASAAVAQNATPLAVGQAAPALEARTLDGDRRIGSADFAGKVLVLNFWATWCPPCRAETPGLIAAYKKLHAGDVAFLAVDTTEVTSVVKTFVSAKGVNYPVAMGAPDAYNRFGVAYIPTTVVLDPRGIVRATYTGELPPERLADFIRDARAGKNYVLESPDQTMVEKLLDPALYSYTGDSAAIAATVARAKANADAAETFGNAHGDPSAKGGVTVDFMRLEALEGAELLPAGNAALAEATTPAGRVAARRLIATADGKLNRFADAVAAYRAAQADDPSDATLQLSLAKAAYRLHDYATGVAAAQAYVAAKPDDADGWDYLALLEQRDAKFAAAAPAYEKTLALLRAAVPAAKAGADREEANANVADTSLDLADVYVALHDAAGAARAFAQANAYGDRLDPKGTFAELHRNVRERTQEGLIAVRLAAPGATTMLSVARWTGPDLPGSLASTLKYRLMVVRAPNSSVELHAIGLPAGWIASFCAGGLCSPGHVRVALSDAGIATYEFQLVPPRNGARAGRVSVASADGTVAAVPI